MTTLIDRFVAIFSLNDAAFRRGVSRSRQALRRMEKSFRRIEVVAASAFTAFQVERVFSGIVDVQKRFQGLEAQLTTFTGSAQTSAEVFRILQDFSRQTSQQVDSVTTSFNRLVGLGLDPSIRALRAYGDIAVGTGKRTIDFVEAVADATVGEFERLKEFGIKAGIEGDKVSLRFKGNTRLIENSSAAIQAALIEISETSFAGGLERQADTIGGALTRVQDSWDRFVARIGNTRLGATLAQTLQTLDRALNQSSALADALGGVLARAVEGVTMAFKALDTALRFARKNADALYDGLIFIGQSVIFAKILSLSVAFIKFARAITLARVASAAFVLVANLKRAVLLAMGAGLAYVVGRLDEFEAAIARVTSFIEKQFGSTIEGAKSLLEDLGLDFDGLESDINDLGNAAGPLEVRMRKALESIGAAMGSAAQTMNKTMSRSAGAMEDSLTRFFTTGKLGAKNLVNTIIAEFVRLQVVRPFLSLLGLGGGGLGLLGGIFGKATGGNVFQGRPIVVGERGPELFVPPRGGRIVGNAGLSGMGAGTSITIHQTIDARGILPGGERILAAAAEQAGYAGAAKALANARRGR